MIGYVRNPKYKQIKIYYLKEAGIDLYPIIFELLTWTKNHLDMKFLPISEQWYNATEKKLPLKIISDSLNKYRNFREATLNKMAI